METALRDYPATLRGMIASSLLEGFVHGIGIASSPLHSRAFRNTFNPFQQMRERLHIVFSEARKLPPLNPRPGTNIRNGVLPLAITGKIVPRLTGVLARQADLQYAIDPQCLVLEALDGVFPNQSVTACQWQSLLRLTWDLLLCEFGEVVYLSLIRRAATMPEEQPLKCFVSLEFVREAEDVFLVGELDKIQELCAGLHDGERWRLSIVHQYRNTALHLVVSFDAVLIGRYWRTIGIETKEPVFLLFVGHDISTIRNVSKPHLLHLVWQLKRTLWS